MNVYAESSAVLAWLLGDARGDEARAALAAAQTVLASSLTLIECDRVLIRAATLEGLPEAVAAERRARLAEAARHWALFAIDAEVVERARRPFPREPIRTLDAIHLATAAVAQTLVPDLALLALDERVRQSARLMGLRVVPEADR